MKRRLGFLPFLIFIYTSGFSQTNARNSGSGSALDPVVPRADIIAHSPEAEAVTRYGVLPLTLYTGLPQISVPIFEIKASGLSLPFSLSYNYNGFKPTETASWCGFGWSLQGAGSISKIIKGQIDGTMGTGKNYDDFISVDALAWNQTFLTNIVNGVIDPEPDVYIFNVGGYSGKFVMIKGQAYLFPFQNLKITSTGTGFKLIDDKGNVYLFNDLETTFTGPAYPGIPNHTSAWQLSQIITADKKDTVRYTYQTYSFKQPSTYTDRYSIDTHLVAGDNSSGQTFSRTSVDDVVITSLALSSVTSRYANLSFVGSGTDRLDMIGSTGGKVLDKIVINKPDGTLQKEFVLTHDYYANNSKLKLKETFERQYTNGDFSKPIIKQHYLFEYQQETNDLSLLQTQYGTDYWGYYNGAYNQMLFDQGSLSLNYVVKPYANRNADASASSVGMMKKITYPTGGYTTFEFEQNQKGTSYLTSSYTNSSLNIPLTYDPDKQTNGLTEKHSSFTLNKGQMVKLVYGDTDDFNIPTVPILKIYLGLPTSTNPPIYTSKLYSDQFYIHNDSTFLNAGRYYLSVTCESGIVGSGDLPYSTFGTVNYKTYTSVNTLADGPGLRVKKISSYDGVSTAPAFIKQYTYTNGVELTRGAFSGNNLYHDFYGYYDICYYASSRSALSDLAETQFYYGQVTESTQDATKTGQTVYTFDTQSSQLLDVKLTSQTDYKYVYPDYVPIQKTTNSYALITRNSFVGFKVYKSVVDGNPALPSPDATQASYVNQIYSVDPSEVYALISDNSLLQTTKEYVYGVTGVDTVDNRTDYYYDNVEHIYPTRIVATKNNGDQITQTLKYPLDYNFNSCVLPDAINTNFKNDLATAITTMNTNYSSLLIALINLQPYYPNTSSNQSAFATIANQYHLQADLQNGVTTANGNRTTAFTAYTTCLSTTISNNTTPWKQSVAWMQLNNMVSPVIEKYISIKKLDGNEYMLGATRNEFQIFNSLAVEPVSIRQTEISTSLLKSTFLTNPDLYYKPQLTFTYDQDLSVVSQQKNNDAVTTYLYGYKQVYPLAEIKNATFTQVLAAMGLTTAQYKTESYAKIPSTNYLSKINALRQNLPSAMITTYVQNPLVGILSASDPNNVTSYYDYDVLGRLIDIKDNNGKILKAFEYHYQQ